MKCPRLNAVTKTEKSTAICKTIDKVYEIYSKRCKEGPSKVTKIATISKSTKTAIFAEIQETFDKIYEIYSKRVARMARPVS